MAGIEFEYWDSCVFLAFLKNETTHGLDELESLKEQARKFDLGTLGLVTSTITVTEIYEARLNADEVAKFRSMYSRSNFQFIDAAYQVCLTASEIRGYYKDKPVININGVHLYPSTPDAIHVASAIAAQIQHKNAIKLITFDSKNKAPKNELALTNLSGIIANKWTLTICRPPPIQQQNLTVYE